jgi:hypothetical protein
VRLFEALGEAAGMRDAQAANPPAASVFAHDAGVGRVREQHASPGQTGQQG